MMNFRQRVAWLAVGLYLLLSVMAAYYICEVQRFSFELVEDKKSGHLASALPSSVTWTQSLKTRLLLLPLWVWATIFLLPYLQLFLFLYSCTRADPRTVGYCFLPLGVALLCSRRPAFTRASNQIGRLQLIDT